MFYVYILLLKNRKLYTGFTRDIKSRFARHLAGKVLSTKDKVLKLLYYEAYMLKSDALRREKYLKTTEGKRYLRQQIRDLLVREAVIEKHWGIV